MGKAFGAGWFQVLLDQPTPLLCHCAPVQESPWDRWPWAGGRGLRKRQEGDGSGAVGLPQGAREASALWEPFTFCLQERRAVEKVGYHDCGLGF